MVFSNNPQDWDSFISFLREQEKQVKEARVNTDTGQVLQQLIELGNEEGRSAVICKDIALALNKPVSSVAKEIRALGLTTMSKHVEIGGKRKSVRAIAVSEDTWQGICKRYYPYHVPRPPALCQACQPCQSSLSDDALGTTGADGTLYGDSGGDNP
jgi:hypothetical protein